MQSVHTRAAVRLSASVSGRFLSTPPCISVALQTSHHTQRTCSSKTSLTSSRACLAAASVSSYLSLSIDWSMFSSSEASSVTSTPAVACTQPHRTSASGSRSQQLARVAYAHAHAHARVPALALATSSPNARVFVPTNSGGRAGSTAGGGAGPDCG